jgi:TPP-dependent pyruvate/acetoin dehydrogenase alpha subunit
MPRKKINIPDFKVEYLSILNEKGELDKKLEPKIPDDLLVKLHRAMLLARRFDESSTTGSNRYFCAHHRPGSRATGSGGVVATL